MPEILATATVSIASPPSSHDSRVGSRHSRVFGSRDIDLQPLRFRLGQTTIPTEINLLTKSAGTHCCSSFIAHSYADICECAGHWLSLTLTPLGPRMVDSNKSQTEYFSVGIQDPRQAHCESCRAVPDSMSLQCASSLSSNHSAL